MKIQSLKKFPSFLSTFENNKTTSIALSGGSTASYIAPLLPENATYFLADERLNQDFNSTLYSPFNKLFPDSSISDPVAAAQAYTTVLKSYFSDFPKFSLILLGIGPDGHTASLFPGFTDTDRWVDYVIDSPKPPPCRITLSLNVINNADYVAFVVTGDQKGDALKRIFKGDLTVPAARVTCKNGVLWFLDDAAIESMKC